jgi:HPt (histidine-containing phosphotransfer) domain-containing protein
VNSDRKKPEPVLDRKVLQRQSDDLGAEDLQAPIIRRLVATFVENAQATVPLIEKEVSEGRLKPVADMVHQLKSGALFVGAQAFARHCTDLKRAAKQRDLGSARRLTEQLPHLFGKTRARLEAEVGPVLEE